MGSAGEEGKEEEESEDIFEFSDSPLEKERSEAASSASAPSLRSPKNLDLEQDREVDTHKSSGSRLPGDPGSCWKLSPRAADSDITASSSSSSSSDGAAGRPGRGELRGLCPRLGKQAGGQSRAQIPAGRTAAGGHASAREPSRIHPGSRRGEASPEAAPPTAPSSPVPGPPYLPPATARLVGEGPRKTHRDPGTQRDLETVRAPLRAGPGLLVRGPAGPERLTRPGGRPRSGGSAALAPPAPREGGPRGGPPPPSFPIMGNQNLSLPGLQGAQPPAESFLARALDRMFSPGGSLSSSLSPEAATHYLHLPSIVSLDTFAHAHRAFNLTPLARAKKTFQCIHHHHHHRRRGGVGAGEPPPDPLDESSRARAGVHAVNEGKGVRFGPAIPLPTPGPPSQPPSEACASPFWGKRLGASGALLSPRPPRLSTPDTQQAGFS
ncbi:protein transport protein SEC31-like [Tachyglossus aculeatus]|uniref:protein transport protein SEC31-like n=1 Tax=Tachyglossus aculeatus TaxID=9261 RepID=UPI0018F3456D|nr:protein transport protein SEC31-like [Tachyglossus aculeatus]